MYKSWQLQVHILVYDIRFCVLLLLIKFCFPLQERVNRGGKAMIMILPLDVDTSCQNSETVFLGFLHKLKNLVTKLL